MKEILLILRLLAGSKRRALASVLITVMAARAANEQDRRYERLLATLHPVADADTERPAA